MTRIEEEMGLAPEEIVHTLGRVLLRQGAQCDLEEMGGRFRLTARLPSVRATIVAERLQDRALGRLRLPRSLMVIEAHGAEESGVTGFLNIVRLALLRGGG